MFWWSLILRERREWFGRVRVFAEVSMVILVGVSLLGEL